MSSLYSKTRVTSLVYNISSYLNTLPYESSSSPVRLVSKPFHTDGICAPNVEYSFCLPCLCVDVASLMQNLVGLFSLQQHLPIRIHIVNEVFARHLWTMINRGHLFRVSKTRVTSVLRVSRRIGAYGRARFSWHPTFDIYCLDRHLSSSELEPTATVWWRYSKDVCVVQEATLSFAHIMDDYVVVGDARWRPGLRRCVCTTAAFVTIAILVECRSTNRVEASTPFAGFRTIGSSFLCTRVRQGWPEAVLW